MQTKEEMLAQYNRNNIIEAAKVLFAEKGLQQATMDQLAKQAGVSKSTVYVYFSSKEEIHSNIIFRYMSLLHQSLRQIVEEAQDFKQGFYRICHLFQEYYRQHPLYFESIMGRISVDHADFERMPILRSIYEIGEEINETTSRFFAMGIAQGYVSKDTAVKPMIFILWSGLASVILLANQKETYFMQNLQMTPDQFMKQGFDFYFHALLEGGHHG